MHGIAQHTNFFSLFIHLVNKVEKSTNNIQCFQKETEKSDYRETVCNFRYGLKMHHTLNR